MCDMHIREDPVHPYHSHSKAIEIFVVVLQYLFPVSLRMIHTVHTVCKVVIYVLQVTPQILCILSLAPTFNLSHHSCSAS